MSYADRRVVEHLIRRYGTEYYYKRLDSYYQATALVAKKRMELYDQFARPVFYPATGLMTIELLPEAQEMDDYLERIMNDAFLRYFPEQKTFEDDDE